MSLKSPVEGYNIVAQSGYKRSLQSVYKTLWLSFLGGAYIAIGGFLAVKTTSFLPNDVWGSLNRLIFGGVFPIGLMLILLTGAELFTGNCMSVSASWCQKQTSIKKVLESWLLSWSGNFVGGVFFAYFIAYASGLTTDVMTLKGVLSMPDAQKIVGIANSKVSLSFIDAFLRGILANWLVCLAVYLAALNEDLTAKVVGFWIPVAAFVALGGEHSIANMFFVPLGIFAGSDPMYLSLAQKPELTATWTSFAINNLVPVTLGNIVGGAVFVTGFKHIAFNKLK